MNWVLSGSGPGPVAVRPDLEGQVQVRQKCPGPGPDQPLDSLSSIQGNLQMLLFGAYSRLLRLSLMNNKNSRLKIICGLKAKGAQFRFTKADGENTTVEVGSSRLFLQSPLILQDQRRGGPASSCCIRARKHTQVACLYI